MVTLDPNLPNNLPSAHQQPSAIDATLKKECEAGHILEPFLTPTLENFCTSGIGVIPKHNGGWCIIYHLSAPDGLSIIDFIDPFTYSLTYCPIDDAYTVIKKLGSGTLLCKIDLKYPFCLFPGKPSDWNLLGLFCKQNFMYL